MLGSKKPKWQTLLQEATDDLFQRLFVAVVAIAAVVSLFVAVGVCLVIK